MAFIKQMLCFMNKHVDLKNRGLLTITNKLTWLSIVFSFVIYLVLNASIAWAANTNKSVDAILGESLDEGLGESKSLNHQHKQVTTKSSMKLADKFYRQALYFYFQNKTTDALQQLSYNQQRLKQTTEHALLFEAGLQMLQGMPQQAQRLLTRLLTEKQYAKHAGSGESGDKSAYQTQTLMLVVLLQLAEQKVAAQEMDEAKKLLSNINVLPHQYAAQYYLLQQLIAWPEQPNINEFMLDEQSHAAMLTVIEQETVSPYVVLNQALVLMNQQQYSLAHHKLTLLKNFTWPAESKSFWQTLFSSTDNSSLTSSGNEQLLTIEENIAEQKLLEAQGLNHYAQLLLAQLYIEQNKFQQSYDELNSFPQATPFSEQALFLFGYSALKLNQHQTALAVLKRLVKEFPYSEYSQQALALIAEQYLAQQQLTEALNQYLLTENYYQEKLLELTDFMQFLQQDNLLPLYHQWQVSSSSNTQPNILNKRYLPWLNIALTDQTILTHYQQLDTVSQLQKSLSAKQEKVNWLNQTITLNQTRRQLIKAKQNNIDYQAELTKLEQLKNDLQTRLSKAKQQANGELFANKTEQVLLARIAKSQQSLKVIDEQESSLDYQQRLTRVHGILKWQLQQKYHDRYWQHQAQLEQLKQLYLKTKAQYNQVNTLLVQPNSLLSLKQRQQKIAEHAQQLVDKNTKLKSAVKQQLLIRLNMFIQAQEVEIKQHLLFNQRAMANVIERINQQEAL